MYIYNDPEAGPELPALVKCDRIMNVMFRFLYYYMALFARPGILVESTELVVEHWGATPSHLTTRPQLH
jgi:hypothetical protein